MTRCENYSLFCDGIVHCCDKLPKSDVLDFVETLTHGEVTKTLIQALAPEQRDSMLHAFSNLIEHEDAEQRVAFFKAVSEKDFLHDLLWGAPHSGTTSFLYSVFKDVNSGVVENALRRSSALTSVNYNDDFKNMAYLQCINMLAENKDLPEIFCKYAMRDRAAYEADKRYGFMGVYNSPAHG